MKKIRMNLQLFADGAGDGAGTATSTASGELGGTEEGRNGKAANPKGVTGADTIQYGKAQEQEFAEPETVQAATQPAADDKQKSFEELIKGDYKDAFNSRVQSIVQERLKGAKNAEAQLNNMNPLIDLVSRKYGVDPGDVKALTKAIEEDSSFFEEEASRKGLSVQQYKELMQLEKENAKLKETQRDLERRQNGEKIYAGWMQQGEELKERYGISDFELNTELQNPDFLAILKSNGTVEAAYKATHFDDLIGGGMARTAQAVTEKIVNNVTTRANRPAEGAASSQTSVTRKTDVSKLTNTDMKEIEKRVRRGEKITF